MEGERGREGEGGREREGSEGRGGEGEAERGGMDMFFHLPTRGPLVALLRLHYLVTEHYWIHT
jgi:hypothetical protein